MEFKDLFNFLKTMEFPYLLSLVTLVMGMISILFAVAKDYKVGCAFMIGALIFALIDDKIAKIMKRETEVGYGLEKISELVAFGIAPVVVAFQTTRNIHNGWIFAVIIYLFFLCAAGLNTARTLTLQGEKHYEGLPILANGILVPIFYYVGLPNWYPLILLASAIAMILSFKIKKFV